MQPDCPDIQRVLSRFIARLIIDDCIAPAFVSNSFLLNIESEVAIGTILDSYSILKDGSGEEHGKRIWDATFSSAEEKSSYVKIVKKFFEYGNVAEAVESISKMKWKFFLHEFVRILCVEAISKFAMVR